MAVRLQPITQYNGYDCENDPHHLFSPLELARLAVIDRRINRLPPTAFDDYEPECKKPRQRVSPEERRARQAKWRELHRAEKREKDRVYRATHSEQIKAYCDARRDIANALRREKRKIKKEATHAANA